MVLDCCLNPTAPPVGFKVETIVVHILEPVQSACFVDLMAKFSRISK